MSVTLHVQERTSARMVVDALLDTGSLAGDFIAEDVVVRYNLKPVLSDTSYTVCSGLDNPCLKSNTILLLRVTFFDESSNRYDTFDIRVHILKATPVTLIIGGDSIKKFNFFSKDPSQLGIKLPTPNPSQPSQCTTGPCDCPSDVPLTPVAKPRTGPVIHSLLASLTVEAQHILGGSASLALLCFSAFLLYLRYLRYFHVYYICYIKFIECT